MLEKCIKVTLVNGQTAYIKASEVAWVRPTGKSEEGATRVGLTSGEYTFVKEDPIAILTAVPV